MENVILVIHLIIALALIAAVLLQRSEGGGLGMGGGGGGGANTGRPAVSGVAKLTWGLAIAFIATSIALTIIAAQNSSGGSVLDRITDVPALPPVTDTPTGADLLPPVSGDAPLAPPRADD